MERNSQVTKEDINQIQSFAELKNIKSKYILQIILKNL